MPTLTLQRYLDHIEVWALNNAGVQYVEYEGQVDEVALARAFTLLCRRHPVLTGKVRFDGHGYLLQVPSEREPDFVVLDGDERTLLSEARRPWDPGRSVARLILVRGEARGVVAVRMDHSVVDARSWTTMFYELWRFYTDIVDGCEVTVAPGDSLPCGPCELFEKHFGQIPSEYSLEEKNNRRVAEALQGRTRLTVKDTARLIAVARARNTSVHALVCGAILVAHRAQGMSTAVPTPMACLSPIDFRNRVDPPVAATETTNFLRVHKATVTVTGNGGPVTVGRDVKAQLKMALADREFPPADMSAQLETPLEQRLATVFVSNIGVMPRIAQPAGLTITDWRRLVPSTTGQFPTYGTYTYEDRLSVLYFYSAEFFREHETEQIVGRITDLLCGLE